MEPVEIKFKGKINRPTTSSDAHLANKWLSLLMHSDACLKSQEVTTEEGSKEWENNLTQNQLFKLELCGFHPFVVKTWK